MSATLSIVVYAALCAPTGPVSPVVPDGPATRVAPSLPDIVPYGTRSVPVEHDAHFDLLFAHCCVQHVVVKGDTLGALAVKLLGDPTRVREIVTLNPGIDPKRLRVGQRIWMPPRTGDASTPRRFVYYEWRMGLGIGQPFAAGQQLSAGRFGFVIVPAAERAAFEQAQQKGWGEIDKLAKEGKVELVVGHGAGRYVAKDSPVVRRVQTTRVHRDRKGRFSLEVDTVSYDKDGAVVGPKAAKAKDEDKGAWLLLLAFGGAGLVWLRVKARARGPLTVAHA